MTDNSPIPPGRRRNRRRQLSVRAFLVLVLALGCAVGVNVRSARIQQEAVTVIRKSGGAVFYDEGFGFMGNAWADATMSRPQWFASVIGVNNYSHVTHVSLDYRATDFDLGHIGRLDRLEWLSISSAPISDIGLGNLRHLKNLRVLYLHGTGITDGGLAQLRGLRRLEHLTLLYTRITDQSVPTLKCFTELKELELPEGFSATGLQELKNALPKACIGVGLHYHGK
jgi:hypothetical protein